MPEIIELGWCGARRLAAYKLKWTVRCCRRTVSVGGISCPFISVPECTDVVLQHWMARLYSLDRVSL